MVVPAIYALILSSVKRESSGIERIFFKAMRIGNFMYLDFMGEYSSCYDSGFFELFKNDSTYRQLMKGIDEYIKSRYPEIAELVEALYLKPEKPLPQDLVDKIYSEKDRLVRYTRKIVKKLIDWQSKKHLPLLYYTLTKAMYQHVK